MWCYEQKAMLPISADPSRMSSEEFNALKREALTLLHRTREYEDLTAMTLLDQAREHGVTNVIDKGYNGMLGVRGRGLCRAPHDH